MAEGEKIFNNDTPVQVSERFAYGDLCKLIIGELRQQVVPWGALPEKEQQKVIDRVAERVREITKQIVNIVAGKTRPTVLGEVESVTFKDGVKVVLTFSKSMADRHAIADAAGDSVLLVLPHYAEVLGGDEPKPEPNQPELAV